MGWDGIGNWRDGMGLRMKEIGCDLESVGWDEIGNQ